MCWNICRCGVRCMRKKRLLPKLNLDRPLRWFYGAEWPRDDSRGYHGAGANGIYACWDCKVTAKAMISKAGRGRSWLHGGRDRVFDALTSLCAHHRREIEARLESEGIKVHLVSGRVKSRESLAHMLCEPCPTCEGKGQVKTARSVCYDILREILREARQFNPKEFRVVASATVSEAGASAPSAIARPKRCA